MDVDGRSYRSVRPAQLIEALEEAKKAKASCPGKWVPQQLTYTPFSELHVRALDVRTNGVSRKDLVKAGEVGHIWYDERYGSWVVIEDRTGRVLRAHQLCYVETIVFERG